MNWKQWFSVSHTKQQTNTKNLVNVVAVVAAAVCCRAQINIIDLYKLKHEQINQINCLFRKRCVLTYNAYCAEESVISAEQIHINNFNFNRRSAHMDESSNTRYSCIDCKVLNNVQRSALSSTMDIKSQNINSNECLSYGVYRFYWV